jgi:hypothetical protein
MDNMDSVGSDANDATDASVMGTMIVVINSLTLIWPMARKIMTGTHHDYYEKLLWVLSLPSGCYMKYCGGEKRAAAAREKQKQERADNRRAAGVRRANSMLPTDTTVVLPKAAKAELDGATEDTSEEGSQHEVQGASRALLSESDGMSADLVLVDQRSGREAGRTDVKHADSKLTSDNGVQVTRKMALESSYTAKLALKSLERMMASHEASVCSRRVTFRHMHDVIQYHEPGIKTKDLRKLFRAARAGRDEVCDRMTANIFARFKMLYL